MKRFLAAIQFLTILPLPAGWSPDARALGGSLPFFPVVGLAIGMVVTLADGVLGQILPLAVTSVLTVILLIAASGALHLDGLADTADGLFSARPRERVLEIMHDSRTGPMGVAAIVSVLALKIAHFTSLAAPERWWILVLTPVAGRCALLLHLSLLPYLRPEGGLATVFHQNRSRGQALWAILFLLGLGTLSGGFAGFLAAAAAALAALLLAAYLRRRLGGLTGDTLGAACELTELAPALAAAALLGGVGP